MNLIDIAKKFATEEACVNYLEAMRWPEGVHCLKCDGQNVSRYQTAETSREVKNRKTGKIETKTVPSRFIYQCMDSACHFQFSVTTGTIFSDTHLSLEKWFNAVALMCNAKKGLSAMQMQRDLRMAYKTAWYLNHRIRKAMMMADLAFNDEPLDGVIEADETFIGSKKYDRRRKRGKYEKEPVFGIVQRNGKARTYHFPQMNRWQIAEKLKGDISIDAKALYTDDGRFYQRVPENIQHHEIVNHRAKEWVRGDVHTGTIDGYWGLLKRGIIGSFHKVSIKHLHRYLSEFQFRWNNREAQDMFPLVIAALVIGVALPYAELIEKKAAPISSPASDEPSLGDVPF
jgi:transposase-like protein